MNMFEVAAKKKLRFESPAGLLTVENLWDLPIKDKAVCLNTVGQYLLKEVQENQNSEFSENSSVKNDSDVKLEIVRYIIEAKKTYAKRAEDAALSRMNNNRIRDIIEAKKAEELSSMSIEDLEKMLNN